MGIYFSPAVGIRLKSWSFSNGKILDGPPWKDERPTYYIFHSHGISPTPWQFWIEFKVWYNVVYFIKYVFLIKLIPLPDRRQDYMIHNFRFHEVTPKKVTN